MGFTTYPIPCTLFFKHLIKGDVCSSSSSFLPPPPPFTGRRHGPPIIESTVPNKMCLSLTLSHFFIVNKNFFLALSLALPLPSLTPPLQQNRATPQAYPDILSPEVYIFFFFAN
jgi:hypothetical protein